MLEKDEDDQLGGLCEEWRTVIVSQVEGEYHTNNKKKED